MDLLPSRSVDRTCRSVQHSHRYVKIGRTTDLVITVHERGIAVVDVAIDTRMRIIEATRARLLADGYAGLSTRKVAEEAGVLFSQENNRLLTRQAEMYAQDKPLWQRYEQACDFLEDDLESGYVRVLQEMLAAGWSEPAVGAAVRELLLGWYQLLTEVMRRAESEHGPFGPFTAEELATLIANCFIGSEEALLLGFDRQTLPIRAALRRVGS